jgi:hypothetical protein
MKASELRIGNLITHLDKDFDEDEKDFYDSPKIASVQSIANYGIVTDTSHAVLSLKYFKPIPLSEEWLLKFRFIKKLTYSPENDYEKYHYEIEFFGGFYLKGNQIIPLPYYFSDAFSESLKILYVHQLQNLYFALTGEELTLKA